MWDRVSLVLLAALVANGTCHRASNNRRSPAPAPEGRADAPDRLPGVWKVIEQAFRTPGAAWTVGNATVLECLHLYAEALQLHVCTRDGATAFVRG